MIRRIRQQIERLPLARLLGYSVVLISALAITILFYDFSRENQAEIENLQTGNLVNDAQELAQRLDDLVRGELSRVANLSLSRAVQEFIGVRPDQRSELFTPTLADFTNFMASNSAFQAVLLLDASGEVLISTEGSYVGQNFANSDFFTMARQGEVFMSDPGISALNGRPNIWLAAPVYTEDNAVVPRGVVAVSLSPNVLWQPVREQPVGQNGYAVLVDRYGIRLAHGQDPNLIFRSLMPLPAATWKTLQAGDRFAALPYIADTQSELLWDYVQQQPLPPLLVGEFNDARQRVYFSGARMTTRDWTVLAMLPETEVLAPARRVTSHGLAAVIILTTLLGVTVVWLAQRIMRPVPQLVTAARKIAGGDLSTPVAAKGSSELGELAENFETMRQHLQKSQDELAHWAQTLETRVVQRSQEVAALSEVIAFASLSESRTDLMRIALELSLKVMDAEMGGIWLADQDGTLTISAQNGFDRELSRELTTFAPNEGLLGRVQATGHPVAVDDISHAPLLARAVIREYELGAFAAVPLRIHGRNLGVLGVFSHSNQPFSSDAVLLAASIAQQIALTLDNMALVEQVQAQAHSVARLQERERIAAEIHDSVAQTHGYIYLQVDNMAEEAADTPRREIRQQLIALRDIIDNLSSETRSLIAQLRDVPPPPPTGLEETVRREVERLTPELNVHVDLNLAKADGTVLSEATSAELARIVGEAVRNAQRHGQAKRVQINFERQNGSSCLSIVDDGVGFDPTEAPKDGRSHFGLSVMEARAGRIGGSFNIDSRPGDGTRVLVCWPAGD